MVFFAFFSQISFASLDTSKMNSVVQGCAKSADGQIGVSEHSRRKSERYIGASPLQQSPRNSLTSLPAVRSFERYSDVRAAGKEGGESRRSTVKGGSDIGEGTER